MKGSSRTARQAEALQRLWAFDQLEMGALKSGWMAGVDEAGRGPLAGPVVAAAVILLQPGDLKGVKDSKKLSATQREKLYGVIARAALVGIGVVDEKQIDAINIYEATRLAMKKAILNLPHTPALLLIDGNMRLDLPIGQKAVVQGDQKSLSISSASIIAKVFRDHWMRRLHEVYPAYAFAEHKGYGTAAHLRALETVGPSPVHRYSFSPVREAAAAVRS